jgi:hypothetical protein
MTVSSTLIVPEFSAALSGAAATAAAGSEGSSAPSPVSTEFTDALVPVRPLQAPSSAAAPPELAFAVTLSSGGAELAALALSGLRPPPATATEQAPWTNLHEYGGHRPLANNFIDQLAFGAGLLTPPDPETAAATAAGPPPFSDDERLASAESAPVETVTIQDAETYLHPLYQVAERGDRSAVTDLSGTALAPSTADRGPWTMVREAERALPPGPTVHGPRSTDHGPRSTVVGTLRRFGRTLVPIAATWAVIQAVHSGFLIGPRRSSDEEAR